MPQHTQTSNDHDNRHDMTDSGTYKPTGKGFGYPPLIYTDPEVAANLTDSDTIEIPQLDKNFIGEFCKICVTKWPRCLAKPKSDWDDDLTYTAKTQMEGQSNEEYPLPSDWSDQERVWTRKTYEEMAKPRHKCWKVFRCDETDWNENLYTKTQCQFPSRCPLPGWPKGIRKQIVQSPVQSPPHTEDPENEENLEKGDSRKVIEVYYKPAERYADGNIIEGL